MTAATLPVVQAGVAGREPVHDSITPAQISDLVERFYARVRKDARLGPIFEARMNGHWADHLDRMKAFWSSVLLRSSAYKGQPVPAHLRLTEVVSEDFRCWLVLFRRTAGECFEAEAARLVIAAAERIARSLWLALFGTLDNRPPDWIESTVQR